MTDQDGSLVRQSRYYDPELGRFIQPDSIVPDPGSSQSLNRYSYVLNNPLKYVDPSGHVPQPTFWNPDLSGRAHFDLSGFWNTSFNSGPSRQWFKTTSDDVGWLGAGLGRDWFGLGFQAGGYRTSELPSNNPDPYAHWDYSRTPSVGETVKAVASVALLAVPGSAPVRIIGATMRVARAAAAARVGATFGVTRMAPIVAKTGLNLTRGWKVGDPINNLTSKGNIPTWNTVRQRFWKNEALNSPPGAYSGENLARMQRGLAPQRINPNTGKLESMELHHTPAQRHGGLFDVKKLWPDEHAAVDPFRHTGN